MKRTRTARACFLLLLLLGLAGAAHGQYTAVLAGNTATFTGTAAASSIVIDASGGLLRHNLFTQAVAGFNSNFDWDSTVPGDQTLSATDPAVTVIVNGNAGIDQVTLGSGAVPKSLIDAAFVINGGADGDTLTIDDSADVTGRTVSIDATTVIGIGGDVTYSGLETFVISTGSGNDRLILESPGVPAGTTLTLNNGLGTDLLVFFDGGVAYTTAGGPGAGQTTITQPGFGTVIQQSSLPRLGGITASMAGTTVSFTGSTVDDAIFFDSSGGLLRHNLFTQGQPGFASDFDWDPTTPGDQTLSASDPAVTVLVQAGLGNDTVVIGTPTVPASSLAAAFTIDGGGGMDTSAINNAADATGRTATVGATTITGVGGGTFTYTGLETLSFAMGSAGDIVNVNALAAGLSASISVNNGGDTVNVTGAGIPASSQLFVDGGAGVDTLTYNSGAVTPVIVAGPGAGQTTINRTGSGSVIFQNFEVSPPSADVSITKSATATVLTSGAIVYTIVVTNNGPTAADSVVMTDVMPPGTTFTSLTSSGAWTLTTPPVGGNGTVTATIATLASGLTTTFTLTISAPAAPGIVSNTATVTSVTSDPDPADNSATATTTVIAPTADLAVTKAGPPSAILSSPITYTITVTNNGPQAAANVAMTDVMPPGTTFTSFTGSAGWTLATPPVGGNGTVTATIATLASGASGTFMLAITAPATVAIVNNTATVTSITSDPDPADNSATATTIVAAPAADLAVTKTGPATATPSGAITYTLTVTNSGPQASANVVLTDVLPAGTTFTSFTASAGWTSTTPPVGGTGTVTATIASLPSGASGIFTLNVTAPSAPGVVSNTAIVGSGTVDLNLANNSSTATTTTSPPVTTTFTGPTATGSGTATASFTGGGATCTFTKAAFIPVTGGVGSPPAPPPGDWFFPHGLFDFALGNCAPGSTVSFTITYPQPIPPGAVYWKYGPTPSDASPHWYQLPVSFAGNTATFSITDGALGDDDLTINGIFIDQGGPAIPLVPGGAVQTPTLSEWALLLLATMVLLVGMRRRQVAGR